MNLILGVTSDDIHKCQKNITQLGSYTGVLKDDCSMENPHLMVQVPEATVQQANYCAFTSQDLGRNCYYYITDKIMHRSGVVEIVLEMDPLMTYKDELYNVECTVDRTSHQEVTNAYLIDNEYQILACENIVTKKFPIGFTDESMILLTVG